jgi:SAM-dependent methyltransferase
MGDVNQRIFVQKYRDLFQGPYLEVGSKDYGSTQNLRILFPPEEEYLGVDLEPGPGVDLVLDLTLPWEKMDARLAGRRFGTIFCLSVLEHCQAPWRMAENLTRLLRPGGYLLVSAPFAWKFHAYPNDYWRFTPEGIRQLFDRLEFDPTLAAWATSKPGEFYPVDGQIGKIRFRTTPYRRQKRWTWAIGVAVLRFLRNVGLLGFLADFSYVLAPTNIMMIGKLPESEAGIKTEIQ